MRNGTKLQTKTLSRNKNVSQSKKRKHESQNQNDNHVFRDLFDELLKLGDHRLGRNADRPLLQPASSQINRFPPSPQMKQLSSLSACVWGRTWERAETRMAPDKKKDRQGVWERTKGLGKKMGRIPQKQTMCTEECTEQCTEQR